MNNTTHQRVLAASPGGDTAVAGGKAPSLLPFIAAGPLLALPPGAPGAENSAMLIGCSEDLKRSARAGTNGYVMEKAV